MLNNVSELSFPAALPKTIGAPFFALKGMILAHVHDVLQASTEKQGQQGKDVNPSA